MCICDYVLMWSAVIHVRRVKGTIQRVAYAHCVFHILPNTVVMLTRYHSLRPRPPLSLSFTQAWCTGLSNLTRTCLFSQSSAM